VPQIFYLTTQLFLPFFPFQELQRRLDQTLGKPGSYLAGIDRVGNVKPMTVGARLYRVEQQLSIMDKKLDQIVHGMNALTTHAHHKVFSSPQQQQQHMVLSTVTASMMPIGHQSQLHIPTPSSSQSPSPVPMKMLEEDV
jgi:hypothetical protein